MYPKKLTNQVICNHDFPIVETLYGKIRGILVEKVFVFKGIDYAKAKRFQLAEEPDHWTGIKDALVYGPTPDELSTNIPPDAFVDAHYWYPQSEFCQNLNIWTPGINDNAKRPVMVWIHGGGQEHGSAIEIMAYDGAELALYGNVVVVSVNHRLNALGYLDLSAYGDRFSESGYVGMMDLVQALRWIRDNITGFGGDPENILLFGQSGGGFKIIELMQMPAADGLYHKVAIESGTGRDPIMRPTDTQQVAKDIVDALGLREKTIQQIETIPFFKLASAVNAAYQKYIDRTGERLQWVPPLDNKRYFGNPLNDGMHFRKETMHIPMMVGSTLGEFDSPAFEYPDSDLDLWGCDEIQNKLFQKYGDSFEDVLTSFQRAYPDKRPVDALFVDAFMRPFHIGLSRLRARMGCAPVYNWVFALTLPCFGGITPWHNAEEAYVFHHAEYFEATFIPCVTELLQNQMAGAWASFAYKGDPNTVGLPFWEPVAISRFPTMIFDRKTELRIDHDTELMALLVKLKAFGRGGAGPKRTYGGGPRAI